MHPFVTAAVGTARRRRRIDERNHECTARVPPAPALRSSRAAGGTIVLRCLTPADAHHVARSARAAVTGLALPALLPARALAAPRPTSHASWR